MRTPMIESQLDYWLKNLANASFRISLPTDKPSLLQPHTHHSYRGASVHRLLSASTTDRLRELALESKSSEFMVILGLLNILLHKISGERDIVIGSVAANRGHNLTHSLIGYFANSIALRVGIEEGETVSDVLQRSRQTTLDALERQVRFTKRIHVTKAVSNS